MSDGKMSDEEAQKEAERRIQEERDNWDKRTGGSK